MESNLIVSSLNQLTIGIWEDMRLLFGDTEVQNQWKYTLPAEAYMTAIKRPGNTNDKIRNLS